MESLVVILCYCCKKIFNRDRFTSVVQASNHNNSDGKVMQHASNRNFWNLSTKVGGVAIRKFGPIPQFGGFHRTSKNKTATYPFQIRVIVH